jgi:Mrp family chromosome partitioning ATPase
MTTNQAFIKAYRRDAAESSPINYRGATNRHASIAQRASATVATPIASDKLLGSVVAYVSPAGTYDDPSSSATIPASASPTRPRAPSDFSDSFPIVEPRPTESRQVQRVDPSARSIKRPLSAYLRSAASQPSPKIGPLEPGTTIASLHWPKLFRQLITRHGRAFDGATDVILAQTDAGRPLVGVIGHYRGVGCTTTTLCLAAQLARRDRRVAVVEGHLQAPQFAACLGVETTAWLQDMLEQVAPLADALLRAEDERLDLLMLDPCNRSAAEDWPWATSGPAIVSVAQALRNSYDVVLVDLGTFFDPIWQPAALNLVREMRIEAAVAVTGPEQNDDRDFDTIARHLQKSGCELLGTIINRAVDNVSR